MNQTKWGWLCVGHVVGSDRPHWLYIFHFSGDANNFIQKANNHTNLEIANVYWESYPLTFMETADEGIDNIEFWTLENEKKPTN